MPTSKKSNETERPVPHHQDPDAPKTTANAVSADSVPTVRLTLRGTPPEIPAGAVVEIDLFGEGVEAIYASMLASCGSTDAEKVIDAADKLVDVLHDLQEARAAHRSRYDVEHWTTLIRRMLRAEHQLYHSRVDGISPVALLVEKANRRILLALRDGTDQDAPLWKGAEELLRAACDGCLELAEKVKQRLRNRPEEPPQFAPLSEGMGAYNNAEDFGRGITIAARLGLDLNELEVGRCAGGDVARVIRGRPI